MIASKAVEREDEESMVHTVSGKSFIPGSNTLQRIVLAENRVAQERLLVSGLIHDKHASIDKEEPFRSIDVVVVSTRVWSDRVSEDELSILVPVPTGLDVWRKIPFIESVLRRRRSQCSTRTRRASSLDLRKLGHDLRKGLEVCAEWR